MIIDDHRWFEIIDDRSSMIIVPQRWSSKIDRLQRWCIDDLPVAVFDHRVIIGQIHRSMIIDDATLYQSDDHRCNFHFGRIDDASMMHRWRKKRKLKIQNNNRNKNVKLLLDVQVVKGSLIIDDQCVSTMIIADHRWSSMINADEKDFHELQIMNNIFYFTCSPFRINPVPLQSAWTVQLQCATLQPIFW